METFIESIRLATTSDASDEARAAGANACRAILIALEAKAGEPLALTVPQAASTSPIAAMVAGLRGVPVDQLLDLAITKLRAIVPEDTAPQSAKISIPLIQVPRR